MYVYFYKAVNLHSEVVKVLFLVKTSCRFHGLFSLFMALIGFCCLTAERSSKACTEDSPAPST